jgi:hypothetical protein
VDSDPQSTQNPNRQVPARSLLAVASISVNKERKSRQIALNGTSKIESENIDPMSEKAEQYARRKIDSALAATSPILQDLIAAELRVK